MCVCGGERVSECERGGGGEGGGGNGRNDRDEKGREMTK